MTIKGFENEDIEVSEFGEWVGKDYIDYKSDYKEHQKIINELLKQKQELIDYLKENIEKLHNDTSGLYGSVIYGKIEAYEEILNKIEKE